MSLGGLHMEGFVFGIALYYSFIQYKNVIILLYLEGGKGYFRDS